MGEIDQEIATIEEDMALGDASDYWHSPAKQERYGQLLGARETGVISGNRPGPSAQRLMEIEADIAKPQNSSRYWHDPAMQAAYQRLLAGGQPSAAPSPETSDMTARIDSAFEGIPTAELDASFAGLPDTAQLAAVRVLADPSRRQPCCKGILRPILGSLTISWRA